MTTRIVSFLLIILALMALSTSFVLAQGPDKEGRIVGGEEATPGAWPWQALVQPGGFMCGGSLITPEWVLTAAHCLFDGDDNPIPADQVTVVLGAHNITQIEPSQQQRQVAQAIPHPQYDPVSSDNDIALLRLATAAMLTERVQTVSLISMGDEGLAAPGTLATVTGWGALMEGGAGPDVLYQVSVPVVSNDDCNTALGGGITANMLCAGLAEGGKDSCQGDSGGPLVVPDGANWKQAGVVSFGQGCARPNSYGVYARVSQYIDWISEHTGETPAQNQIVVTATASVDLIGPGIYLPMIFK